MMDNNTCYKEIGDLIRINREKLGYTQEALSLIISLSRSTIANIEVGRQPVRIHYLYRIADALNISIHDLLP